MANPKTVSKSTALQNWDEQLAKDAAAAALQEQNSGSGTPRFSIKGGVLKLNDNALPNSEVVCVVLESIMENALYEGEYDPEDPAPPVCYAFGRADDEMGPHKDCAKPQAEDCEQCEHNQWGSAEKGRGKACKNRRKLAVIAAGVTDRNGVFTPFDDADQFATAEIAHFSLPPTAIKGWGGYVKQLSSGMLRPPHGVYTRIKVQPDAKTQVSVSFSTVAKVDNAMMGTIMQRRTDAQGNIETPYPKPSEKPAKPAPKGKRKY